MQFIKRFAAGIVASLLLSSLIVFGLTFGLQRVFITPDTIKSALKDSGFYQNIVPNALEQAQKDQESQQPGAADVLPIDRPEVKSIVQNAASPSYLQSQVDNVLDSTYAWLQGKDTKLRFNVGLTDIKARLSDGVEQYALQYLPTLPVCPAGTPQGDLDPFSATCLPAGADVGQIAAEAKDQIANGELFKDTELTADSIKVDKNGKTLAQQVKDLPTIYRAVNLGVYIAGIVAVLLAATLIFLSETKRSGIKKAAVLFLTAGAFCAALGWLCSFVLQRGSQLVNEPLQLSFLKVLQTLADDLRGWWIGYGIILILLGIISLLALKFTKPRVPDEVPHKTEDTGPKPDEKGAAKPSDPVSSPKPIKKLVQ